MAAKRMRPPAAKQARADAARASAEDAFGRVAGDAERGGDSTASDDPELEGATDVVVRLYRSHPSLGPGEQYVAVLGVDDFSHDMIKRLYGGGRYKAIFWGARTNGDRVHKGNLKQETFTVDQALPPKHPEATPEGLDSGAVRSRQPHEMGDTTGAEQVSQALSASVISLLKQYQEVSAIQSAALRDMLSDGKRGGAEWDKILAVLAPIVGTVITAMLSRKQTDPIEEARKIAQLHADMMPKTPKNGLAELADALKALEQLKAIAVPSAQPAGDAPWWSSLVEQGAGVLATIAARQQEAQHNAQPAPDVADAEPGTQVARVAPPAALPEPLPLFHMHPMLGAVFGKMKPQVLIQWAREGRAPEWVAETLLYEIEGNADSIAEFLSNPAVVPQLVQVAPALTPFEPWLQQVRAAIVDAIHAEGEELAGAESDE